MARILKNKDVSNSQALHLTISNDPLLMAVAFPKFSFCFLPAWKALFIWNLIKWILNSEFFTALLNWSLNPLGLYKERFGKVIIFLDTDIPMICLGGSCTEEGREPGNSSENAEWRKALCSSVSVCGAFKMNCKIPNTGRPLSQSPVNHTGLSESLFDV